MLKKHLFRLPALLLFLASSIHLHAQQITTLGKWTTYLSQFDIREITIKDNKAFAITSGGLFYNDLATKEIGTYTTVNGMSGTSPSSLYYAKESNLIFIGYPNGMINYFSDPSDFHYITDIHRNELFPNKSIFEFFEHNGFLYIATEFGLVVYDIDKNETSYSVTKFSNLNTGTPVNDVCILNDTIWVSIFNEGIYRTSLNQLNLTIPSVWQKASGLEGLQDEAATALATTSDHIFALVGDSIYEKTLNSNWTVASEFMSHDYNYMSTNNFGDVFATVGDSFIVRFHDGLVIRINNWSELRCGYVNQDRLILMGDRYDGLQSWYWWDWKPISPSGPINNFVSQLGVGKREFYIAPRGRKGPSDRHNDRNGIYYYSFENGWKILSVSNNELDSTGVFQDFARVYYDQETETAYMGSWGDGVVILHHGDTVKSYSRHNSPMSIVSVDSTTRVSGLVKDRNGTLWISLILSEYTLNAVDANGNWYFFPASFPLYPVGMIQDDYGNLWINNYLQGIAVFSDNGTLGNYADDKIVFLNSGSGTGGLPNNSVYSMCKDQDGQIWVGTNEGVTVFYDPGSVFYTNFSDASCPIVDGFCLLRDQKINSIAVDGANRKWIGTENGVYLVSEDGTEQLLHFTTENSPLPIDVIRDISIDPATGEVFIGTDLGLVSYMGDATEGMENSDSLIVFPNPVRPDFTGQVVIRQSVENARVKITNLSGMMVKELISNGGQTTWDLTDAWGERVKPGIYLAMVGDREGQGAGITKIVVLDNNK